MAKDEWDDESDEPDPVAQKARQFQALQIQIAALDQQAKAISLEIAGEFPAGVGKYTKVFGDVQITLTRSERWNWDREAIKLLLMAGKPGDPLADDIRRACIDNVSFHKAAFVKLSAAVQKALRAALTIKDGPFKLDVEDKAA
jgi:hypothetical protein